MLRQKEVVHCNSLSERQQKVGHHTASNSATPYFLPEVSVVIHVHSCTDADCMHFANKLAFCKIRLVSHVCLHCAYT